jgi:hypothetical protein
MRIEKSVTSITWIPSEAISGMPKLPFEMGVAHYDDPPPDKLEDLEALRQADAFREANELRAWVEFDDGKPSLYGYSGGGHIGVTRIKLGQRELTFAAVRYPLLQAEPEVGDGWVKFKQSAGGHMGLPAPRRVKGKPFFRVKSASAWTTLGLTIKADGTSEHSLEALVRSRGTGSTTTTASSWRSRGRSTSAIGTRPRTARTRPGAKRIRRH